VTASPNARVVASVRALQDERDELLELLGLVTDGYVETSPDGLAMVLLPTDVLAEIRRRA
jgi:hypothetical protein